MLSHENFHRDPPSLLVVDRFYKDPDAIRAQALSADYGEDNRYYKGLRSKERYLFPYVKERFELLLGMRITDWLAQPANGVFQKTTESEPLVWHSDTQSYAAAIYLTPLGEQPALRAYEAGTSFWSFAGSSDRRPSSSPERNAAMYSEYNLLHDDNWQLVDRIGHVYNRLVLWDAQLIHSATSYAGYTADQPRLVQLFFFTTER